MSASILDSFRGRRVLVTGHTGFKGAWLTAWLVHRGADVLGYSLAPPTSPALFDQLNLRGRIAHVQADVRDLHMLTSTVSNWQPDFVFHLAAQSLVRRSYEVPVETISVNVLGTVHVLESIRKSGRKCVAIMVTSDKCYENKEWIHGYRETDPLGGIDPYSSSKAMAELSIASYRAAYFSDSSVGVASVRAGNVIGGGDWAVDRIVPDAIRALTKRTPILVRNPQSRRPWLHVLEPLHGYLRLASLIDGASNQDRQPFCGPFNFGPPAASNLTVAELADAVLRHWPADDSHYLRWIDQSDPPAPHEATLLHLASDKAHQALGWHCVWSFDESVRETVAWYHRVAHGQDPMSVTMEQIQQFELEINRAA